MDYDQEVEEQEMLEEEVVEQEEEEAVEEEVAEQEEEEAVEEEVAEQEEEAVEEEVVEQEEEEAVEEEVVEQEEEQPVEEEVVEQEEQEAVEEEVVEQEEQEAVEEEVVEQEEQEAVEEEVVEQEVVEQEIVEQQVQVFDAMALDCVLDDDFVPVKDMNEEFVLRRNFIEFHVHVKHQEHYRGNGHLVLTTKRLILVNRDDPSWGSFSLPLRHTFDEEFDEGMAGRFHINGHCRNDDGLLPDNAHFKVWFNQGGGLRFQHIYRHVLNRARDGVEFGEVMVEIQDPEFGGRCNEFGPCEEETLFFMEVQPIAVVEQEVVQEQVQQQVFDALALDCALDGDFIPIKDMNEEFVLRRNFIEFHIHVEDQGHYRGNGHLVLTTKRLVLVNRDDPSWGSFSMPLKHTFDEEFEQGMAGRFHINAHCRNDNGFLPNNAHFKVWFNQGGGLRFQHIYRHVLERSREGVEFGDIMIEIQGPEFGGRCNEFGPCDEETLFFMEVQPSNFVEQEVVQEQVQQQMFDALALDVALDGDFMPVRDMNEQFVLRRNFIEFHIHVEDQGHYRGNGHLILTTKRLVLVNRDDPSWGSFSMPLLHTFNEEFDEGLAGRFHINAHCRNDSGFLPNNAHFKVWFNQGGGLRFQHIYRHVLNRSREGCDFNGVMVEIQDPMFIERCNEFGPCEEETVFFMQPAPMMQQPVMQQQMMQQPVMQQQMMMQQQQQIMFDVLAMDCALDGEFMPVRDMNEQFVLRRNFIEFHIHVRERGDFRGRGHLTLTTKRLVLVNREDPSWGSFSLPLRHTFDERFEEGLLGRFHIEGHCRNDMGMLPHNAHFKVWFEQGGGLRFQHIYRHVLLRAQEGVDFNGIMLELQEPRFVERCNEFGPCEEENVFFMQGNQAAIMVVTQEPYQQQPLMQPEVIVEVRPQRVVRDDGYEEGNQNKGCCSVF